jgi:two-component system sensor histidine kinase KdpD
MMDSGTLRARPASSAIAFSSAAAICLLVAGLSQPLLGLVDLANIVMLFLLAVFLVAWKLGRGPAIFSAFLSVALFDFFFVPPQLSFAVSDVQYLITFAVMLAVGLITSHLTVGLRHQAEIAREREVTANLLYALARDLAGALSVDHVRECLDTHFSDTGLVATLHLQNGSENPVTSLPTDMDETLVRTAMSSGQVVETDAISGNGTASIYLPLIAPMRVRGVMGVIQEEDRPPVSAAEREFLRTSASLVAIAIERLHYVDVAQRNHIQAVSERLRSSILSAISHDVRTPLTALVGMADSLTLTDSPNDDAARALAADIRDQARALNHMVSNLLDMARLHAGRVELRQEWQLFEDVIGASLQLLRPVLGPHPVIVRLAPGLPLVRFDAVLIERVICNLIENAAKFGGADSPIEISAAVDGRTACLSIRDHGPGFPSKSIERVFEMFERGVAESRTPGVGLGLAISRAIVEAHDGTISARNAPDGGAVVTVCLPRGEPPPIAAEEERGERL